MKTALIIFLIAIGAGAAIGGMFGYQQYGVPRNEFGPFSLERPRTSEDIDTYLASLTPQGVAKVEIVGGNEFDFGVMRRNAEGSHQFVIKNVGTGRLDLDVVGSTCKCTVGSLREKSLAPGESTVVEMEWTAKTGSREFSQSATLRTTDPTAAEISLVVGGDVVDMIAAEPQSWNLGDLAAATPIHLRTTLFNYSSEPVEIVRIQWMDERFEELSEASFERRELDPDREGAHREASEAFDVTIDVAPGMPQGRLQQTLRIEYRGVSETELHPPLELVLTGRLVGALSVLGGAQLASGADGNYRLRLGTAEIGEVKEAKAHVLLRGPHKDSANLRIASVEPAGALEAELGEGTDRGSIRMFPLVVKTKADAPEMERDGTHDGNFGIITIESDHPEVAPIRIGVVFRIGNFFGGQ